MPPAWRLPEGVDAPLWQYANTPRLAAEEDAYFSDHPLFRIDARILDDRFTTPGRLVDLGCGAGRHALRFAVRGFTVAAVDLSRSMLEVVGEKACAAGVEVLRVEANLCRLGCFADASFDYALSMFSTLGMIRGRDARRRALGEWCRILRPGGRLALHAHNLWLNLRDRQGRAWLIEARPRDGHPPRRAGRAPDDLPRHPRHARASLSLGRVEAIPASAPASGSTRSSRWTRSRPSRSDGRGCSTTSAPADGSFSPRAGKRPGR